MSELLTLGRVRLVAGGEDEAAPASGQPKRVALLAYLALARANEPTRRDTLVALFWPDLGDEEARRALRQALHYLRRVVGDVFVSEGDAVGIRAGALRCDAVELERLIDSGNPTEALDLYRGEFLDGFHVDDVSPEYEEWVDRTRARLRRKSASAAWTAADAAEKAGENDGAITVARRARDLEPDQEGGWRRLMSLHERVGDRAGALRAYDELADRLAREFDAKPAPETTALAQSIRRSERPARGPVQLASEPAQAMPATDVAGSPVQVVPDRVGRKRRSALIVGLAGAAVLVGGWIAYIRLWDSSPSLVAEGALAPKDRILVAPFADQAGDALLSAAITEAFRVDLAQSPLVRVLTPQQVRASLTRMARSPDVALDDSLAREVAAREGVKAIVTGAVGKLGGAYTVSARLVSAQAGEALAAFRETASDSSELIDAVDRVSKQLRRRIGESLRELRSTSPLDDVTTPSLEALRQFTDGRLLMMSGRRAEAIARYEEAIRLDSTFATAYLALGQAYGAMAEPGRSSAALAQAVAHQQRLPFIERSFAVATHAAARRDLDTAIDAYRRLLERYPDDYRALNNLAIIYRDRRRFPTAESLFVRAAEIDSTISNLYFGIHDTQVLQGKFAESRRTLDLIARRFPGNPVLNNVEIQDAAAQQNWELAARHAEATIAAHQSDTLSLVDPFEALAAIAMTQGRLDEAERYWRTQLALSAASKSHGRHLFGLVQLALLELRHRDAPARALALVDSSLARMPLDSVLPGDRPYDELARFYAVAGRLTRARELLAAAESNDRTLARNLSPDRAWTRGVIALVERRPDEAEDELRQAAETHFCPICPLPDLARAYEAAGKLQTAAATYDRYVITPWLWRYENDGAELGWALKRLAELYDEQREPAKAAVARSRLVQLWQRADSELRPVVAEARSRLTGTERRP